MPLPLGTTRVDNVIPVRSVAENVDASADYDQLYDQETAIAGKGL